MWGPLLYMQSKFKINDSGVSNKDVATRSLILSAISMFLFLVAVKALYRRSASSVCPTSGLLFDWVSMSLALGSGLFFLQFIINMRYGSVNDVQCYDAAEDKPENCSNNLAGPLKHHECPSCKDESGNVTCLKPTSETLGDTPLEGLQAGYNGYVHSVKEGDSLVCKDVQPAKRSLSEAGNMKSITAFIFVDAVWGVYGIILAIMATFFGCAFLDTGLYVLTLALSLFWLVGYILLLVTYCSVKGKKDQFIKSSEFEVTFKQGDAEKGSVSSFLINGEAKKELELEADRLYLFTTSELPPEHSFGIYDEAGLLADGSAEPAEAVGSWGIIKFTSKTKRTDLTYRSSAEGGADMGAKIIVK